MIFAFNGILRYFAPKARETANLKKRGIPLFFKNKKRKTTKIEEMVIYENTDLDLKGSGKVLS